MARRRGMGLGTIGVIAVCCFAVLLLASASPPIPFDQDGHIILRKGSRDAALKVEVYLDLACSDCALAWPVLAQAAEQYEQRVEFLYRLLPLPYHHNAFTAAQAAQVVRVYSDGDESAVESFMQSVLEGQEDILNDATADLSQSQVEAIFSAWAVDTGAVIVDDFRSGMADRNLDLRTRYQFKYGCIHGAYGTPMVFVGGILADDLDGGATLESWHQVLDPLLDGMLLSAGSR